MGAITPITLSTDLINTIKYSPEPCCILSLEGHFLAVSEVFYQISATNESILGKLLFDVFPDNPDAHQANAVNTLRGSIKKAIAEKKPYHIPLQQYDIP